MQTHLEVVESPVLLEPLTHCLVAVGKNYKRELQPYFKVCRVTHGGHCWVRGGGGGGGGGGGAAGNGAVHHISLNV